MGKTEKRNRREDRSRILITCAKGTTPFLADEIRSIGLPVITETIAGVATEGSLDDCLRMNLLLRTGHRVLYLLREFTARDAHELYNAVSGIPWENYISADGYFCITSSVDNSSIMDSRYANLKCKDAIADRFREKCGRRPDSGADQDRTVINLYWKDDYAALSLDTSGEPLSRRGYRRIPLKAPLQETLAAAIICATGWRGETDLVNPMCGSGTLAIEAAMMGLEKAPGSLRNNFGFMHIRGFNAEQWNRLRDQAEQNSRKKLNCRIIATDIRKEAVEAARKNAAAAGVDKMIEFSVCDYASTPLPGKGGIVVLNPEYGERMGKVAELESLYKGIGDYFKQKCTGYTGYLFTGSKELSKKVGLRPKRRVPFFNGAIECRLLEYELYEGTKKGRD